MVYVRRGKVSKRSGMSKAKRYARKKVDRAQNSALASITRRLKKLEATTVERKYLQMTDTFNIGQQGQVKSRQLVRFAPGTYDGLTTTALFGSTGAQGDYEFAKYMLVDVLLQAHNTTVEDENNPSPFSLFLLKHRKDYDANVALTATNALDDNDLICQGKAGQAFANPKAFSIVKQVHSVIGGVDDAAGYGVAHRRYRFKIPINKKILLQSPELSDNLTPYPQSFQDNIYLAISMAGSGADLSSPECTVSVLMCFDDAGDN